MYALMFKSINVKPANILKKLVQIPEGWGQLL